MKKTLSIILTIFMILISIEISVFAEQQVEGLHEKLNALFIKNNFTEEELQAMDKQVVDEFNRTWSGYWKGWQKVGKYKTEEMEYAYRLNYIRPDFEYGILVTMLSNNYLSKKYSKQYSSNNVFGYIFDNFNYYSVISKEGISDRTQFDEEGDYIIDMEKKLGARYYDLIIKHEDMGFLKSGERIETMLLEKGETQIDDMKIFALALSRIFLYIKCGQNEYLIKLRANSGSNLEIEDIPQIEQYKLYPASEVINALAEEWDYIAAEKPTYETEALRLQSEGLLNGNENGLDLLKPLTRIEAAAMLLRAIGETETAPEGATQAFNDVPSTHWGFGAAINAQNLGIVNGVGDNNFAPDKTVTATEFSTMVLRAANTGEFDWTQALDMLIEQGIITKENSETMDLFTRGDMAKIIYEARNKGLLN